MTDIVLPPVTNGNNVSTLNNNFAKIQNSINNDVLNLDGGNNVMKQDLDLNGHSLLNPNVNTNNPSSLLTIGVGDSRYYNVTGDTLTGPMNVGGQVVSGLAIAIAANSPVRKQEFDNLFATVVSNEAQAVRGPDGESLPALPSAAIRANKVLGFDALGNPLASLPLSGSGTELAIDLANGVNVNKGAALVSTRIDDPAAVPRLVSSKLAEYISSKDFNFVGGGVANNQAALQAALNAAAQVTRKGQREVVIKGSDSYGLGGLVDIADNVRLIFDGDARLVPLSDGVECIRSLGAPSTTTYPLTSSATRGSDRIVISSGNAAAIPVNSYIWIASTSLITTSPNSNGVTQAQMAKVVAKSGGTLIFDRAVEYSYSSGTTVVGLLDCRKNIRIDNFKWGDPSQAFFAGRGLNMRWHDNLKMFDLDIGWSRHAPDPDEAFDILNVDAVYLKHCSNTTLERMHAQQIAWYGVDIDGASHHITVRDLDLHILRHGMSLNWNGPGEPIDVLGENIVADRTTWGGVDCHDVGRDLTYRNTKCRYALNNGAQIRTSNVLVDRHVSEFCGGAGFLVYAHNIIDQPLITNVNFLNVTCNNNGGSGVLSFAKINMDGFDASNNGLAFSLTDVAGIALPAGRVSKANITDSNGPAITYVPVNTTSGVIGPLLLDGVTAPASARQTQFLYSSTTYQDRNIRLRDLNAIGYAATTNIIGRSGSSFIADVDEKGCAYAAAPRCGVVVLVAGSAVITNGNFRSTSPTVDRSWRSKVSLRRLAVGGTVGNYTITPADGSFTITSSSPSDTSRIEWTIE